MNAILHGWVALGLTLLLGLPAMAQKPLTFRSASHPFDSPKLQTDEPMTFGGLPTNNRFALAATGEGAAWYSTGVNDIRCSLMLPEETWLGTAFGVKRLDNRARTVQHYTTLDGLPYNRITALAMSGTQILCASARLGTDEAVALCGFNATTGKWSVLAEEKRETLDKPASLADIAQGGMPHQWIAADKSLACLVPGSGLPGKTVALIYHISSHAVDRIPAPDFMKQPFGITTVLLDDHNGLWMGTGQGLLRYDLTTRKWGSLVTDTEIFGGLKAQEGALWFLARTLGPMEQSMTLGRVRAERWKAISLTFGSPLKYYPLKERTEVENIISGDYLENITLANGKVWMTEDARAMGGSILSTCLPTVYSLDPRTSQVTVEATTTSQRSEDYDKVPASVLVNSHTGWGILTPLTMPDRFPGWICGVDPREARLLATSGGHVHPGKPERSEWNFVSISSTDLNGKFLKHEVDREEYYPLEHAKFQVHDAAFYPVVLGEKVYFLTGQYDVKLHVWDRRTGDIALIPKVEEALRKWRPDWPDGYEMLPGNDCLWIGTGNDIIRYNIATDKVDVVLGAESQTRSYVPRHALLSVEGDMAWVKGAPNRLYRAEPGHSQELTPVALPPFPAELERDRDKLILCALEDHIAWFVSMSYNAPNNRPLIGYNLIRHTWTKPTNAALAVCTAGQTLTTQKQGNFRWFPAYARDAAAYGYNTETGAWNTLPPVRVNDNRFPDHILSVDEQNAWLCDQDHLYHLDRHVGVWSEEKLPFTFSLFRDTGSARIGQDLYFGTSTGVWVYNTTTKRVSQAPSLSLEPNDMECRVMAADTKAVWLSAVRSGACFIARFDRHTHDWRYWSADEGAPQQYGQLTGDGSTCWYLAGKTLYHLNPKSDRWDNISQQLSQGGNPVSFKQVLAETDRTWLVPDTPIAASRGPVGSVVPLYRYDIGSGRITPFMPTTGKTLTPRTLTAAGEVLFLTTGEGVFRLDRSSNLWEPIVPPHLPSGLPALSPTVAFEDGVDYWLIGAEAALRFRKTLR
ncbi:MAG TPA: hypothetical protein VKU00_29260 [Chthonomonadaceae bacterium]|nr:hypothetical protein [Chthonomonadaceae bacterium]